MTIHNLDKQNHPFYYVKSSKAWNGSIELTVDHDAIQQVVSTFHEANQYNQNNIEIVLNSEMTLQVMPVDVLFQKTAFPLSEILNDLLPNLRIPLAFNAVSKDINIFSSIYVRDKEDAQFNSKIQGDCKAFIQNKDQYYYYEAVILNNAHLIWTACRNKS